jgi:tetratricopeptide (TPR) repeat protein
VSLDVTSLDELDRLAVGDHGLLWRPVRRRLGIEGFGVNAWTAEEAGQEVVEHHDETGSGAGKHEELYIVVRGRAHFQLDDEEFDAPVGTCVFVRDRTVRRGAYAEEPGTTVLAMGGKPGEAFEVSPWESYFAAIPLFAAGDYDGAAATIREGLERAPDNSSVLYNLACAESLGGDTEAALEHLTRAVELDPRCAEWARDDEDFDAIRDDPRFVSAVARQPDAAGERA